MSKKGQRTSLWQTNPLAITMINSGKNKENCLQTLESNLKEVESGGHASCHWKKHRLQPHIEGLFY